MNTVNIKVTGGPTGRNTRIELNGEDISNKCRGFFIRCEANGVNVVSIDYLADVEIQLDKITELPGQTIGYFHGEVIEMSDKPMLQKVCDYLLGNNNAEPK